MTFCINCGNKIGEDFEFCPECGTKIIYESNTATCNAHIGVCKNCEVGFNNLNENIKDSQKRDSYQFGTWKNKWVSFFLCLFFGWLGIHKFYEGNVRMGLLYLFTLGLFGTGLFIDLIILLLKPNPYFVKKRKIVRYENDLL